MMNIPIPQLFILIYVCKYVYVHVYFDVQCQHIKF